MRHGASRANRQPDRRLRPRIAREAVGSEPLRALLSPGVEAYRYGSPSWKRWLRETLAERATRAARGRWELDCIPQLAALAGADPEFRPVAPHARAWGSPEPRGEVPAWTNPGKVIDVLLETWHYSRAIDEFRAAALSLAGHEHEDNEAWHRYDLSFGCYRAFLRACRANTAAWLAAHGIKDAWLWRGERAAPSPASAGPVAATLDPLSFWTPFSKFAFRFARFDHVDHVVGGRLLLARVPAARIYSVGGVGFGQPHVGEVVVDGMAGPIEAYAWPVPGSEIRLADPEDLELERLLLGQDERGWRTLAERHDPRAPTRPWRPWP